MISSKIPTMKVKAINEESMGDVDLVSDKMQKTFSEITSEIEIIEKNLDTIIQQHNKIGEQHNEIREGHGEIRKIQLKRDANFLFIDKTLKEIERDHNMKFDFNYKSIIQQDDQQKDSYFIQFLEKILRVLKNLFNIC